MSSPSFLNMLLFFPKDNINGEMVELLQPYLRMEDFNIETAKKVRAHTGIHNLKYKLISYSAMINSLPLTSGLR